MKSNRKIKVLHIFHSIEYSGAELMLYAALDKFQKHGVEFSIIAAGPERGPLANLFEHSAVKVYHKPMYRSFKNYFRLIPYLWSITRFISKRDFDVIHIQRSQWFSLYVIAARLGGIKTVIRTVHNVFKPTLRYLQYYFERKLCDPMGLITITIGPSVYQHELTYFGNRTVRINNWFNPKKFYPVTYDNEKIEMRKSLKLPLDKFFVISVGQCLDEKRHSDILESIAALNESKKNIYYLHLGDGPRNEEEKAKADALGVLDQTIFCGNTNRVRDYLISSDAYVMPSEFEGLGNAAVEAMACGLPCILYNVSGLRDLIPRKDLGFLIDPNVESLTIQLSQLLEMDTRALILMGEKSTKFVNTEFDINSAILKILNLYKSEFAINQAN